VLASYADTLGIRSLGGRVDLAADLADSILEHGVGARAVITLGGRSNIPARPWGDWKTMDDLKSHSGRPVSPSWAWHRTAALAVPAAPSDGGLAGMEVTVLRPEGWGLGMPERSGAGPGRRRRSPAAGAGDSDRDAGLKART